MTPDKALSGQMYFRMRRIRRFEETAQELYRRGTVVGLLHLKSIPRLPLGGGWRARLARSGGPHDVKVNIYRS